MVEFNKNLHRENIEDQKNIGNSQNQKEMTKPTNPLKNCKSSISV